MHDLKALHNTFKDKVNRETGENVSLCYQCGKCTAGCPLNEEMDVAPNQILRMLQYDNKKINDMALKSYSIWLCLSCETCVTRCPKEVNLPEIMDFLRKESIKADMVHPKAKDILKVHESFLSSIKSTGRLFELGLIIGYKLKTGHYFKDASLGPVMFMKGKLGLTPHNIQNKEAIRRIFERTINKKEGHS